MIKRGFTHSDRIRNFRGFLIFSFLSIVVYQLYTFSAKHLVLRTLRLHRQIESLLPISKYETTAKTQDFCKRLSASPRPFSESFHMNLSTKLCMDGKPSMFSQMKQDFYLWKYHFSKLTRRGFYLDVAANEPISISNTYFFDACLGWSGICVEGSFELLADIFRERSCAVAPLCVTDKDGREVSFAVYKGLSGILETNKNIKNNSFVYNVAHAENNFPVFRQTCTTLGLVLEKYGVHVVDYLSLDVEGHELQVLKGINWGKIRINVITVECNKESKRLIHRYLKKKGFIKHRPRLNKASWDTGMLSEDAVFLHSSVAFGIPV